MPRTALRARSGLAVTLCMRNSPLILIVDDDQGFLEIVATKLKRTGYLVAEAHDGAEAVEKAVNLKPDLILMDVNMPNENGTEAVLDILESPETKGIKVAFLTNQSEPWPGFKGRQVKEETTEVAKELGAVDFFNKGDDLDKMTERIKEILKK